MRRHANGRESGFSLVELLVTIVIAGVAFVAMVPMFVAAQQSNATDTMRTISMSVAQDKIEKIRSLDYDQITLANLNSSSFDGGAFGQTWTAYSGGSASRTLNITYTVANVPSGAADGSEQYKKVIVDVYWTGPPLVKHAILQTFIYRQYAGPGLINLTATPVIADPIDSTALPWIDSSTSGNLTLSATVNAADIATTKKVSFAVYASNGTTVASFDANTGDSYPTGLGTGTQGANGLYKWLWNCTPSGVTDGIYTFQAVGSSTQGFQGNTISVTYQLERGAPAAPSSFTATAGDSVVSLSWAASTAGDLSHYEVWRSLTSGAETLLVDNLSTPSYTNTGLTNGTHYYYTIYAVDLFGNRSTASAEQSATPYLPSDTTAPTVPSGVTATPSGANIIISWTASVDNPPPSTPSGMKGYIIYRSPNNSTWSQLVDTGGTGTSYTDAAGYSTTYYYKVKAYDVALNQSAFSSVVSATTGASPYAQLNVTNNNNSKAGSLKLMNSSTSVYYDTSGNVVSSSYTTAIAKKGGTVTYNNIPRGSYTLYCSGGPTPTSQSISMPGAGPYNLTVS